MRVLLVDDNQDSLDLMVELLHIDGHEVHAANDGPSALEILKHFTPELAILDLGLPGMDGNELAVQIRALHGTRTRLIALSGFDATKASPAFDAHLLKPVSPKRLRELLSWRGA
ncbi:MAG: response regulator [Kofleriaceae bacterium]